MHVGVRPLGASGYVKWLCQVAMSSGYVKWLCQVAMPSGFLSAQEMFVLAAALPKSVNV